MIKKLMSVNFIFFSLMIIFTSCKFTYNKDSRVAFVPYIFEQPQTQFVFPGQQVQLSVIADTVEDDAVLTYQWYKISESSGAEQSMQPEEIELPGETDSTYSFICPQVEPTQQLIQNFFVIVKSTLPNGSRAELKSDLAVVTVSRKNAVTPVIAKQPSKLKIDINQTGSVSVDVKEPSDGGTLTYKWYKVFSSSQNPVEFIYEEIPDQRKPVLDIAAVDHYEEYKVCVDVTNNNPKATDNQTATIRSNSVTVKIGDEDIVYPRPFLTRSENLDFIFSNSSVAEVELTVSRSNWNSICNDSYLHGPEIYYSADFKLSRKDEKSQKEYSWEIKNVGLRTKGATSRTVKPQIGSEYQQASFKVDFEEFISVTDPERRLANCIKGLNLKRFKDDSTFVREIYSFDLFRKNGVWTSPRAGYAHLTVNIVEAVDQDNNPVSVTTKDYGIYCMNEEINKQFLKERTVTEGGGLFSDNKGTLWKCWNTNSSNDTDDSRLTLALSDADADKYSIENKINPSQSIRPAYLKTYDKVSPQTSLENAKTQLATFIRQLNSFDFSTPQGIQDACQWYKNRTDVDLLARTFACSILVGGWDEYWLNGNNFYLYFDSQNSKLYLFPYDYDNVLGIGKTEFNDPGKQNPFVWGKNRVRPLIDNFLSVPEFYNLYKKYIKEFSESEYYSFQNSAQRIQDWQQLISDKVRSDDLSYGDTASSIYDGTAITNWDSYKNYRIIDSDPAKNFFIIKQASLEKYLNSKVNVEFFANGDNVQLKKYDSQQQIADEEGSSLILENLLCNSEISELIPDPVRPGYKFLGWTKEIAGGRLVSNLPFSETSINLFASWGN